MDKYDKLAARVDSLVSRMDAIMEKRGKAKSDASFNEGDHPRAADGKFGSGGSSTHKYNSKSVDEALGSAYRGTKGPSPKQRSVTHRLLMGHGD
jgi:hypothetical protein